MRVMVIVKATAASESGQLPSADLLEAMGRYNEELAAAGILLGGEGLRPSAQGARVRSNGSEQAVIEGPFPETEQLLAGFWLWEVQSLEAAIDWVKRCPNPTQGRAEFEIRPLAEVDDFGENATPELRDRAERLRATR